MEEGSTICMNISANIKLSTTAGEKIAKVAACAILNFNFNFNRFGKVFLLICLFSILHNYIHKFHKLQCYSYFDNCVAELSKLLLSNNSGPPGRRKQRGE